MGLECRGVTEQKRINARLEPAAAAKLWAKAADALTEEITNPADHHIGDIAHIQIAVLT